MKTRDIDRFMEVTINTVVMGAVLGLMAGFYGHDTAILAGIVMLYATRN